MPHKTSSSTSSLAESTITKENTAILLAHGAWHSPSHYAPLTSALTKQGWQVHAPQLPSVGTTALNFNTDVTLLSNKIQSIIASGKDVAILCHSYGGIPAGEAAKPFLKTATSPHGVVKIIYLCAYALPAGKNLMDVLPGNAPLDWWHIADNEEQWIALRPEKIFYNDIKRQDVVEELVAGLRNQPCGTTRSRTTWEPYRDVSSAYIVCDLDEAVPLARQEEMLRATGISEVRHLNAGHTPWISKKEDTIKALVDALEGRL